MFKSAAEIAEDIIRKHVKPTEPCPVLPSVNDLARPANRKRHGTRLRHPKDLNFELQQENVPKNFLRGDVQVGSRRHLELATDTQLTLSAKAKNVVHGWHLLRYDFSMQHLADNVNTI